MHIAILYISAARGNDPPPLVVGLVYDKESREPLPGATVILDKNRGTVTDADGNYSIEVSPGNSRISIQYVGYKTAVHYFRLHAGDTLILSTGLEQEVAQMDQFVVSATKTEQRVSESTVSISILQPQSLSTGHITRPIELMNRVGAIEVLDGQASIRGGSGYSYGAGSRVLALIDGLPALSADAGSVRWNFLPLENISQVEIIKGASSVLYGSSALNGIINFRMAEPDPEGQTSFFLETGIFDSPPNRLWHWWDTPRMYGSASFSHIKKYGNTGVALGSFILTDNGYRRLNDEHLGRVNLRLSRNHSRLQELNYGITLHGGYNKKRDFILWEDAWQGALKQSPLTENLLQGSFIAIDPYITFASSEKTSHELRIRLQNTNNHFPEQSQNNSKASSLYSEFQVRHRFNPLLQIHTGLAQNLSRVKSQLYGNHHGWNAAAYSQLEINPGNRISVQAGIRLEHNTLNGVADKLVPLLRAGANYRAGKLTFLRASFGQGYRFPSIAEKHAATSLGAVRIFPNPWIMPESGWGVEAGLKQGIITQTIDALFDIALFYTRNSDLIEYVFGIYPIPETNDFDFGFRATNIEHSRVYGLEIEFRVNHNTGMFRNTISGGYVFMNPVEFDPRTNTNTGVYLKFRRKHAASLNLSTSYGPMEIGIHFRARSRILNIDDVFLNELTREQILPGFYDYWQQNSTAHFITDLSLGYSLSSQYRISLAVKNVFNVEYMGRPGDIQPHRNMSLRISGVW